MNDPAALLVSVIALALSIVSTIVSIRLQTRSSQQTALDQLGVLTQKLIDVMGEKNDLSNTSPAQRDMLFWSKFYALNYKLALLARQADYLIQQELNIVSDVQYSLIGTGLAQSGDALNAEKYWQKAVESAREPYYKIINLRGYADFLFTQGQFEAGGVRYQEALNIWSSDTDFRKYTNGYTYQMWFVSYAQVLGFGSEAQQYYERARQLFTNISGTNQRLSALNALETARQALMAGMPTPTSTGTMPPISPQQP